VFFAALFILTFNHKQTYAQPDLGRGQTDPIGLVHCLKHILHQPGQRGIETMNTPGLLAQNGISNED
jgi:hypothetical protein